MQKLTRVCVELMSGLPEGLELFTDDCYTSPPLYQALYQKEYNSLSDHMRAGYVTCSHSEIHLCIDEERKYFMN